jgi:hypothetical protein
MLDKAENLGINPEGIKSIDRKITEAIELINQDVDGYQKPLKHSEHLISHQKPA